MRFCGAAGLLWVWALVPCAAAEAPTLSPSQPRSFLAQGVVKELQTNRDTLVVAHGAITNYMPAMTMPFHVRQPGALSGLGVGDAISFRLHVTDTESWLDEIVVTSHASPSLNQAAQPPAPETHPAKPHHPLMDYPFTNELGQTVRLSEFAGQALAITFFFTRCPLPDACPRLSQNFAEASRKLLAQTNAPANWHFLSVSFDTEFDTPAVLKVYAQRYEYDPRHWSFLTGPADKIAELAAESDAKFERDAGFFTHNFRTLIIDATGRLQMAFPIGGNLSDQIVAEILRAAAATNAPML